MRRRKKNSGKNNLKTAFIFFILVFALIVLSSLFKLAALIKNSRFDANHSFNVITYSTQKGQNAQKNLRVISFSPQNQSISVLRLLTNTKPAQIGRILKVPIDGTIGILNQDEENIKAMFQNTLLNYKDVKTNLTIIDMARLWFFTKGVPEQSIVVKEFFLLEEENLKDEVIDRISSKLFLDMTFSAEKVSIQIINGTGVLGLGNRLGRLISNIGGNVVAVSTSKSDFGTSEILYSNKNTYTLQRLSRVLGFKRAQTKGVEFSDIIIKIGKDSLSSLVF